MKLQFSRMENDGRFIFHLIGDKGLNTHWVWFYLGIEVSDLLNKIIIFPFESERPLLEFFDEFEHSRETAKYLNKKIRETIACYTGK